MSKDIVARLYLLFDYVFEYVDSRLSALIDLKPDVELNIEKYVLFDDEKSNTGNHKARSVIFPNGNKIEISVNPGKLEGAFVRGCPTISFNEICKDSCISFSMRPRYPGTGITLVYAGGAILKKKGLFIILCQLKIVINHTLDNDCIADKALNDCRKDCDRNLV